MAARTGLLAVRGHTDPQGAAVVGGAVDRHAGGGAHAAIGELSAHRGADAPFHPPAPKLVMMPGLGQSVGQVIVAETGADMTRFPSAATRESAT